MFVSPFVQESVSSISRPTVGLRVPGRLIFLNKASKRIILPSIALAELKAGIQIPF